MIAGQIPIVSSSTGSPESSKSNAPGSSLLKSALRTTGASHYADDLMAGSSAATPHMPTVSSAATAILNRRYSSTIDSKGKGPPPKVAEDPFSAHDFDISIDIDLPAPGKYLGFDFDKPSTLL